MCASRANCQMRRQLPNETRWHGAAAVNRPTVRRTHDRERLLFASWGLSNTSEARQGCRYVDTHRETHENSSIIFGEGNKSYEAFGTLGLEAGENRSDAFARGPHA